MSEPPPATAPSPGRRRAFRWTLALVLPLLLLGLTELGLRAGGYEYDVDGPIYRFHNLERTLAQHDPQSLFTDDPRLFWRMRPNHAGDHLVRTNARGFRTPDFAADKPDDVYRVLCLGDSTTCGVMVPEARAWPRRLAALLSEAVPARRFQVVNLGVPGYTSLQGRRLFEDQAQAWRPDAVVAAFGAFNDWVPAVGRPDARVGDSSGLAGLRLFQLATQWTRSGAGTDPARRLGLDWDVIRTAEFDGDRRVPLAAFGSDLARIAEVARERGAQVVFLAQPLPRRTVEGNPIALAYRDRTAATARGVDAGFADGWAAFERSGRPDAALFRDFCHPGEDGHELLARCVADALLRTWQQ